jgi:hypothetical protein
MFLNLQILLKQYYASRRHFVYLQQQVLYKNYYTIICVNPKNIPTAENFKVFPLGWNDFIVFAGQDADYF